MHENVLCASCGSREILEMALDADKISQERAEEIVKMLNEM